MSAMEGTTGGGQGESNTPATSGLSLRRRKKARMPSFIQLSKVSSSI